MDPLFPGLQKIITVFVPFFVVLEDRVKILGALMPESYGQDDKVDEYRVKRGVAFQWHETKSVKLRAGNEQCSWLRGHMFMFLFSLRFRTHLGSFGDVPGSVFQHCFVWFSVWGFNYVLFMFGVWDCCLLGIWAGWLPHPSPLGSLMRAYP